jgi:hypothetical protein
LSSSDASAHVTRARELLTLVLDSLRDLTPVSLEIASVEPFDRTAERWERIRILGQNIDPGIQQPAEVDVKGTAGTEAFQFFLLDRGDPAERVSTCANSLADAVQEALGSVPFPACPGHPHPAVVEQRAGQVYWCCPTTRGTVLRLIATALP